MENVRKQCPQVCYHRHVKHCGTTEHRVSCHYCPQRFSRKDLCQCHIKKKHADLSKTFHCKECKKTFRYEMALHLPEEHCGPEKPKPFKCSDCGKFFTRKATLEHHQQHFHLSQQGSGVKRALEEEKEEEVKQARRHLTKKTDEKVTPEPDKQESLLEGNKANAYFYPKTKS